MEERQSGGLGELEVTDKLDDGVRQCCTWSKWDIGTHDELDFLLNLHGTTTACTRKE